MNLKSALVIVVFTFAASASAQTDPPAVDACPTTQPGLPLVPPAPYPIEPPGDAFWFGTSAFWTMLRPDAHWRVANNGQISQKVFWWRPGFDGATENFPDLLVTVRRLDRSSPPIVATRKATNARDESFGGSTMLTGISIPAPGCWEITGRHRGSEVTFVVEVSP